MENKEISDFLEELFELSPQEFEIAKKLRSLIKEVMPEACEKLSYNVPYYSLNRRVCFLWPSIIPKGAKEGVQLGFCYGNRMDDPYEILEKGNRAQVHVMTFKAIADIKEKYIKEYLYEAKIIDAS